MSGARATKIDVIPLGAHRELILGRAPSAAIRFDAQRDVRVGRHHARIVPLAGAVDLHPGDVVRLGDLGPQVEVQIEMGLSQSARGVISS